VVDASVFSLNIQENNAMSHWKKPVLAGSLTLVGMMVLAPFELAIAQAPTPSFPMPAEVPSGTTVKLDGSSSMKVMNDLFKQRFEQKFAGSQINLNSSNSDDAVKALVDGTIDVAALGRPLTAEETAKGLLPAVLAREKIAVIVGPNNPFQGNISFAQFAKIFRGEITNWSELGGAAGPIRFIDRPENSDTRRSLSPYPVFAAVPFQAGSTTTAVADDTAAVTAALGQDGISYAAASQVLNNADVRIISMHQTLPDDLRYPYSQPRNYVYKAGADGQPNPAAAAFLGYATSPDGQAIVQAAEATVRDGKSAAPVAPVAIAPATTTSVATAPVAAVPTTNSELPPWWWLPIAAVAGAGGLLWWFGRQGAAAPVETAVAAARQPVGVGAAPVARTPDWGGAARTAGAVGVAGVGAAAAAKLGTTPVAPKPAPVLPKVAPMPAAPVAPTLGAVNMGLVGTAAAVGAGALAAGALAKHATKLSLQPVGDKSLYAAWDIPQARQAELKQQGAETLQLKLHDATMIDIDQQPAHSVAVFDCDETKGDQLIPIDRTDRDYVAELGYKTRNNGWLSVAKSKTLQLSQGAGGLAAGAAGVATMAAIAAQTSATTKNHPETSHIMLNRPTNTYVLDAMQVTQLTQQAAVQQALSPGHYTLKIAAGGFSYRPLAEHAGEPLVMLWLKGGKLKGDRAQVETTDTWLTLNGYGDEYKVQILEPTTLYAFFVDTHKADNAGEVTVKVTPD
jgi:phosphate transport system substrate-binding protein